MRDIAVFTTMVVLMVLFVVVWAIVSTIVFWCVDGWAAVVYAAVSFSVPMLHILFYRRNSND